MVSATVSNANPQTMENKLLKPIFVFKSYLSTLKDKKKEKAREKELREKQSEAKQKIDDSEAENAVASILEPFKNLEIHTNKKTVKEEDERDSFTFKVIEDDISKNRIYSQSSDDSGFADNVVDTLEKLTLYDDETDQKEIDKENTETKDDTESKDETKTKYESGNNDKKKKRNVIIARQPIRKPKVSDYNAHPYAKDVGSFCKPINQINKQTLSGGQVIVNPTPPEALDSDDALQSVAQLYSSDPVYWEGVLSELIPEENSVPTEPQESHDAENLPNFESHLPIYENSFDFTNFLQSPGFPDIFPTPPRSENVPSPLSESQAFYASHSDYTLSPSRSSPVFDCSDVEKYQEISQLPHEESFEEIKRDTDREFQKSQSSMTLKNFKDLQKEITKRFSKLECCDIDRKSTMELFEEHKQKLKVAEMKSLCLQVSKLDLKTAYGILHNILIGLSRECKREELQYALFALVCQRVLAQSPALFVGDFGLSILKAAALRCPHRPLLTRHVVYCVYLVLRSDPKLCANECIFHEVDSQGDNLVIACARGGDAYALVLAEMTRSDVRGDLPPLFRQHHADADGYTALHVASRLHSATSSRLHIVHVLLEHSNADLWKGDIKGGDTAVHLAVNSATCCLDLVMILFKHEHRSQWKKLAQAQNLSSKRPIDYARTANKSATRQNYPQEVYDFLKKCR